MDYLLIASETAEWSVCSKSETSVSCVGVSKEKKQFNDKYYVNSTPYKKWKLTDVSNVSPLSE